MFDHSDSIRDILQNAKEELKSSDDLRDAGTCVRMRFLEACEVPIPRAVHLGIVIRSC